MLWIALVILIIAAFVVPGLGRVLLVILGVGILGVIVLIGVLQTSNKQSSNKVLDSSVIEISDVAISGVYPKIEGKVRNKTPNYSVNSISLDITFKDCVTETQCDIVGQEKKYIWQSVPPNQVRYFKEYINIPEMGPAKGKRSWSYSIAEVKGYEVAKS